MAAAAVLHPVATAPAAVSAIDSDSSYSSNLEYVGHPAHKTDPQESSQMDITLKHHAQEFLQVWPVLQRLQEFFLSLQQAPHVTRDEFAQGFGTIAAGLPCGVPTGGHHQVPWPTDTHGEESSDVSEEEDDDVQSRAQLGAPPPPPPAEAPPEGREEGPVQPPPPPQQMDEVAQTELRHGSGTALPKQPPPGIPSNFKDIEGGPTPVPGSTTLPQGPAVSSTATPVAAPPVFRQQPWEPHDEGSSLLNSRPDDEGSSLLNSRPEAPAPPEPTQSQGQSSPSPLQQQQQPAPVPLTQTPMPMPLPLQMQPEPKAPLPPTPLPLSTQPPPAPPGGQLGPKASSSRVKPPPPQIPNTNQQAPKATESAISGNSAMTVPSASTLPDKFLKPPEAQAPTTTPAKQPPAAVSCMQPPPAPRPTPDHASSNVDVRPPPGHKAPRPTPDHASSNVDVRPPPGHKAFKAAPPEAKVGTLPAEPGSVPRGFSGGSSPPVMEPPTPEDAVAGNRALNGSPFKAAPETLPETLPGETNRSVPESKALPGPSRVPCKEPPANLRHGPAGIDPHTVPPTKSFPQGSVQEVQEKAAPKPIQATGLPFKAPPTSEPAMPPPVKPRPAAANPPHVVGSNRPKEPPIKQRPGAPPPRQPEHFHLDTPPGSGVVNYTAAPPPSSLPASNRVDEIVTKPAPRVRRHPPYDPAAV